MTYSILTAVARNKNPREATFIPRGTTAKPAHGVEIVATGARLKPPGFSRAITKKAKLVEIAAFSQEKAIEEKTARAASWGAVFEDKDPRPSGDFLPFAEDKPRINAHARFLRLQKAQRDMGRD